MALEFVKNCTDLIEVAEHRHAETQENVIEEQNAAEKFGKMFEDQFPVHFFCPKIKSEKHGVKNQFVHVVFNNVNDFLIRFTFCCS